MFITIRYNYTVAYVYIIISYIHSSYFDDFYYKMCINLLKINKVFECVLLKIKYYKTIFGLIVIISYMMWINYSICI